MGLGGRREGAGRKKGSKNKKTMSMLKLLEEKYHDYDPVIAMIEIAQDESNDIDIRLRAHKEVAGYIHPKLRQMDHTVEGKIEISDIHLAIEWHNKTPSIEHDKKPVIEHDAPTVKLVEKDNATG